MPKDTALHKAAYKGDMVGVEIALDEDQIPCDQPGAQKRTALMRAAGANHVEIVKVLITRGAAPTQLDQSGRTPLHWAAATASFQTAKIILNHEIDVNVKTKAGTAPIHLIAEKGSVEFIQALMAKDADIFVVDGDGKTPFQIAKENNKKDAMILLKPPSEGCCVVL